MRALCLVVVFALGACATHSSPQDVAWSQIDRITAAVYLGNDRMKLTTRKPLLLGTEGLEYALLIRAAHEAQQRGAPGFAIVRADYHQRMALWGDDMLMPLGRTWIGSYEDLLAHRDREAQRFGKITGVSYIIVLQSEGKAPLRTVFDSEDTYDALLAAWADAYGH